MRRARAQRLRKAQARSRRRAQRSAAPGRPPARRAAVAHTLPANLVELELELLDLAVRLLEVLVEAVALGDQVLLCAQGSRASDHDSSAHPRARARGDGLGAAQGKRGEGETHPTDGTAPPPS